MLALPEAYRKLVRIGTCSWKYDSWKGLVYRSDVEYRGDDYLAEYAKAFDTVEVDQWFWSLFATGVKLPREEAVAAYARRVPDDFRFTVKAPNALTLTHFYARQPARHADVAGKSNPHFLSLDLFGRFLDALAPLGEKLGPIMLQFEYLNRKKMALRRAFLERLGEFVARLPAGVRIAIETRNPNYLAEDFFAFLRDRGLGFVLLEGYYMPPIGDIVGRFDVATADFSIIRLHGPDREAIEERTGERWDAIVEPRPESLEAARAIVDGNARRGITTYVNVNNHFEGCAPLTIDRFVRLLAAPPHP